jgi:hypothetical protein
MENSTSIEDVKKVFTHYYPCLKIEFYKTLTDGKPNYSKKEALPANFVLGKILKPSDNAIIDMDETVTVAALETQIADIGLTAEVFRKSGNVWVETSLTNNWTLQQQNAEAEELNRHFNQQIL